MIGLDDGFSDDLMRDFFNFLVVDVVGKQRHSMDAANVLFIVTPIAAYDRFVSREFCISHSGLLQPRRTQQIA
jgi:hypothetical protein